jgi:hypothetical protein
MAGCTEITQTRFDFLTRMAQLNKNAVYRLLSGEKDGVAFVNSANWLDTWEGIVRVEKNKRNKQTIIEKRCTDLLNSITMLKMNVYDSVDKEDPLQNSSYEPAQDYMSAVLRDSKCVDLEKKTVAKMQMGVLKYAPFLYVLAHSDAYKDRAIDILSNKSICETIAEKSQAYKKKHLFERLVQTEPQQKNMLDFFTYVVQTPSPASSDKQDDVSPTPIVVMQQDMFRRFRPN